MNIYLTKGINSFNVKEMEFVNFAPLKKSWINIATVLNRNFDFECEWIYVAKVNEYIRN